MCCRIRASTARERALYFGALNEELANMRMNDFNGKEFLAAVRGKDYAHAGEETAIELLFQNVPVDANRKILDAGCGRGGTADYVHQHGWGQVVGIDVEAKSIEYANETFPYSQFLACDIADVGGTFPATFDLIYMFNAFYAVLDKAGAMISLRDSAKSGASLLVFDYITYKANVAPPDVLSQPPATLDEFSKWMKQAGWQLNETQNLDKEYAEWYRDFLRRVDELASKRSYSAEMIEPVRKKYSDLLNAIETGVLGGAILRATTV